MSEVWRLASAPGFARRRLYDAQLALTLRHHGVTEMPTRNVRDFEGFGFERVVDAFATPRTVPQAGGPEGSSPSLLVFGRPNRSATRS